MKDYFNCLENTSNIEGWEIFTFINILKLEGVIYWFVLKKNLVNHIIHCVVLC